MIALWLAYVIIINMKEIKTNAMRRLDKAHIAYETLYYDIDDEDFNAKAIAEKLGIDYASSYKTLALKHEQELFLFVIPADHELDLKKSAKEAGVKNLAMIKVKDLMKEEGFERGNVSPLGVLKKHQVCFDRECLKHDQIIISGAKKGISLRVDRQALIDYLQAKIGDICHD